MYIVVYMYTERQKKIFTSSEQCSLKIYHIKINHKIISGHRIRYGTPYEAHLKNQKGCFCKKMIFKSLHFSPF